MMMGMRHRGRGAMGMGMLALVSVLMTVPLLWLMKDIADTLHAIAEKP
ncbi:MAG: hypothetical protein HPY55_07815 [Firmicutes bacterium]|nr:hypothetical protein [Bacillota bacterium]